MTVVVKRFSSDLYLELRIISTSPSALVLRSALLSLSKDARVLRFSKDEGRPQARSCPRPSFETAAQRARPPQDEVRGFDLIVRYDWFHGIALLAKKSEKTAIWKFRSIL